MQWVQVSLPIRDGDLRVKSTQAFVCPAGIPIICRQHNGFPGRNKVEQCWKTLYSPSPEIQTVLKQRACDRPGNEHDKVIVWNSSEFTTSTSRLASVSAPHVCRRLAPGNAVSACGRSTTKQSKSLWDSGWVSTTESLGLALVACWLMPPNTSLSCKFAFARMSHHQHPNDISILRTPHHKF